MSIDGSDVGRRMAITMISGAFSDLALDFARIDRDQALASLARVELSIADFLVDFRAKTGEGTDVYDEAFRAILDTISTVIEDARTAVKLGRRPTE